MLYSSDDIHSYVHSSIFVFAGWPVEGLEQLVAFLAITDASITASTVYSPSHGPERVRLDKYSEYPCAWVALINEPRPWVQFDMGELVTVWGVIMKPRCDPPWDVQRILSFQLGKSDDGTSWSYVSDVVTADYSVNKTSVSWITHPTRAQYWRIEVVSWQEAPSMKADLIGKGKAFFSKGCSVLK